MKDLNRQTALHVAHLNETQTMAETMAEIHADVMLTLEVLREMAEQGYICMEPRHTMQVSAAWNTASTTD